MVLLWCTLACALTVAHAQSNYGSQANNIEYQGDGLPEQTILDGKVSTYTSFIRNSKFNLIFDHVKTFMFVNY